MGVGWEKLTSLLSGQKGQFVTSTVTLASEGPADIYESPMTAIRSLPRCSVSRLPLWKLPQERTSEIELRSTPQRETDNIIKGQKAIQPRVPGFSDLAQALPIDSRGP